MSTTGAGTGAVTQRRMRADARRNYDLLVTEATGAIAERGADDVSLEEIAKRAGVGIGTLYRHFPTRQSLLEAVFRDQVEALARQAEKFRRSGAPGPALEEWLRAMMAFGRTKRSLNTALLTTLGKDSPMYSECSQLMRETTGALVERAQEAGVARRDILPTDVMRLVHGLIMAENAAPGDEGQAERMLSLVVAGLIATDQAG
ncbi:MAG TPA: TetR/AcrR family transcriptional regulator [Streptosporangiaceae bacterium]